nr:PREDICTED: uncharacterized protein LOC105673276 isoform X2 [Linepithema humile]
MFASSSVERVLSYRSNTMSWQLATEDFPWVEENYVKKEFNHNFQVKCKDCKQDIKYANVDAFKKHILNRHQYELNMERKMQRKHGMWKYFNLTKEGKTRCIVCKKAHSGETSNYSLKHHLSKDHEKEDLKPYESQDLFWKYIDAEEVTNFYGKCTLCDQKMMLELVPTQLLNHLVVHDIKVNTKCSKPKQDAQFWKYQSKKLRWLDKFYTKAEEDFQAKCKICEKNFIYIYTRTIEKHIQKHKEICDYEEYMKAPEQEQIGWKGMRFIDDNASEIVCMVCHAILPDKSFINNHEIHDMKKLYPRRIYWGLKYMKQLGNLAKCTICEEDVKLKWDAVNLKNHVSEKHDEDCDGI